MSQLGTTVLPMEKEGAIPLAGLIPMAGKALWGGMMAQGAYSGAKDIGDGNYLRGAFNLATILPWVGPAVGKGLRAVGMGGRMLARGGKVGDLSRMTASWRRGADALRAQRAAQAGAPVTQAAPGMIGRAWGAVTAPIGKAWGAVTEPIGRGWQWAGRGAPRVGRARVPIDQRGFLENISTDTFRLGSRIGRMGQRLQKTPYGQFMSRWSLPLVFGGPALFPNQLGHPNIGQQQYQRGPGDFHVAHMDPNQFRQSLEQGGYSMFPREMMGKYASTERVNDMADYKTQVKQSFFRTLKHNNITAEEYLDSPQGQTLVKKAVQCRLSSGLEKKSDVLNSAFELLIRAIRTNDPWAKAIAAGGVGTAAGYTGGKMFGFATSPSLSSVENLRKKELISEYDTAIDELQHRMESRTHR